MTLKDLLAVFIIYGHNFKVLHWQANGHRFDRIHKLANEFYDYLADDTDTIAEMAARVGQNSLGYIEAAETLKSLDGKFVVVEADKLYNFEQFADITNAMFDGILKALMVAHESEEIADIKNIGIKSELESIYNKYDLQMRYLNKRRLSDDDD